MSSLSKQNWLEKRCSHKKGVTKNCIVKRKDEKVKQFGNKFTSYESHVLGQILFPILPDRTKWVWSAKMRGETDSRRIVIWPPWDSTVPCRWLFAYFTPLINRTMFRHNQKHKIRVFTSYRYRPKRNKISRLDCVRMQPK